jgi:uncharacterized membrane protein
MERKQNGGGIGVSCAIVGLALLLGCRGVVAEAQAQFIPLGFLPNGNFSSYADAVSDQAPYTVVGYGNTQSESRVPFRWTQAGGMQAIGGAGPGQAFDVSADGTVVVGDNTGATGAWRWTLASGVRDPLGGGSASGVSNDGSVVVGGTNSRGWRWTQATGQVLFPLLPGATTTTNAASAVSGDGRYAVGQANGGPSMLRAFRYDAQTATIIALQAATATPTDSGHAITPDGRIVTGFSSGQFGRWVDGVLTDRIPFGGATKGEAITDDGSRVVGYATISFVLGDQAFIWDAGKGLRNLKQALTDEYGLGPALAGWELRAATGMSADGNAIVGAGTDPSGFQQAFLVLVPEPGACGMFAVAAIGSLAHRRRRPPGQSPRI